MILSEATKIPMRIFTYVIFWDNRPNRCWSQFVSENFQNGKMWYQKNWKSVSVSNLKSMCDTVLNFKKFVQNCKFRVSKWIAWFDKAVQILWVNALYKLLSAKRYCRWKMHPKLEVFTSSSKLPKAFCDPWSCPQKVLSCACRTKIRYSPIRTCKHIATQGKSRQWPWDNSSARCP